MWVAVALCLVFTLAAVCVRRRRRRLRRLIAEMPGPKGLPVLGIALEANRNVATIMDFMKEQRSIHGDTIAVWLGPWAVVLLTDPRDMEIVLNKTATLSKSMLYKVPQLILGYGLLTAARDDWKRYHKITTPAFKNVTLLSFLPAFNEKSRVLVDVLKSHQDGSSFDVLTYMNMCTLDIITDTSLGANMDILKNNRVELVEGLKNAEDMVFYATAQPWLWIPWLMKTTSSYKKMVNGMKVLWDFAENIIDQKLSNGITVNGIRDKECAKESDQLLDIKSKRMGFLDHVVSLMKTQSTLLTKTELRDNTMTVIAGGTDTAASVMSAALKLLGLHQDVQRKVVEELEHIFGDDIHREVTAEDLKKMVYLEQVINETLRLYPPLPIVSRVVEEEVDITGYTLPKGTIVLMSPFITQRDASNFPDPDKFDPDRFSSENSIGRHPYSFIPFLGGRRMCIGKKYAYMQMKTILSAVLRNFRVLPCGSREDMEKVEFRLTLHMVTGNNIKLIRR
ncbi:cytochrome P450 4V2-like [Bacillus rossius redtenbacheri]|uniref:cytochrome P450 4V2-like n=1 Tax=Bacillus rossius redtenbacheri TaxID=93214 RepID=UPI002FDCA8F1